MDRTVGRGCHCCCRGAVHLADMNDCSQRLSFHAAAIFAQAQAAGTGRPFDIHLTSKCLLSRSLLSSLLVSPTSVTRPFILRHDFWPERFCCSTYLLFSFFSPPTHTREMRCLLFIRKKRGRHKVKHWCSWRLSSLLHFSQCSSDNTSNSLPPPSKNVLCFPHSLFGIGCAVRSQTGFWQDGKILKQNKDVLSYRWSEWWISCFLPKRKTMWTEVVFRICSLVKLMVLNLNEY